MGSMENLEKGKATRFKSGEEAANAGRKGGIASVESRRKAKGMRDLAAQLMTTKVNKDQQSIRKELTRLGIKESDQTYTAAVVARLFTKALQTGDIQTIRFLSDIAGIDLSGESEDDGTSGPTYPQIAIPDNGRDEVTHKALMPQAGPQTDFMTNPADIIIYGGAAGGGKTYALLLEFLRHKDIDGFGGVIFRHEYNQIIVQGGLWDASKKIYMQVEGAKYGLTPRYHWTFSGKSQLSFAYIGSDDALGSWQGSEIPYIGFDELTHFTKHQFLYMLSRNRTTCGVRPYVRATCNPDSDSWVAEFISWWIDQDTGYPIKERSGQIKWMVNIEDVISWFDTREEGVQFALSAGRSASEAEVMPKSVTFIASSLDDNKILMSIDPEYKANLMALPKIEMERLLKGNWKIKAAAGLFFKRTQVEVIPTLPADIVSWVRGWDLAASKEVSESKGGKKGKGDPDYTASCLIGKRKDGHYVIADVINKRLSSAEVRVLVKMTCAADKKKYGRVVERMVQDPGQAGVDQRDSYIKMLAGFIVKASTESGSKETRAEPLASQWQVGNVQILEADWNEMYFNQLESFPESKHDDMVDASSTAFNELEKANTYSALTSSGLTKESYWK